MSDRRSIRAGVIGSVLGVLGLLPGNAAADDAPAGRPKTDREVELALSSGPTYHSFYDSHLIGADLGLTVGAGLPNVGWYGGAGASFARTEYGLGAYELRLGGGIEVIAGRLRLSGGLQLGVLFFARDSGARGVLWSPGLGCVGQVSVDLLRFDGHALFVGVVGAYETFGRPTKYEALLLTVGGSALVGMRF